VTRGDLGHADDREASSLPTDYYLRSPPAQPRLPPGPKGLPEGAKREPANGTPGTEPGDREAIYKSLCLLTEQDSALCDLATNEETALALKLV